MHRREQVSIRRIVYFGELVKPARMAMELDDSLAMDGRLDEQLFKSSRRPGDAVRRPFAAFLVRDVDEAAKTQDVVRVSAAPTADTH